MAVHKWKFNMRENNICYTNAWDFDIVTLSGVVGS